MEVRKLHQLDVEKFYQCICENVDWLLSKGIQQWTRPIPQEILYQRQDQGWNYALYIHDMPEAFGSLTYEQEAHWDDIVPYPAYWIKSVVTPLRHKGKGFGRALVQAFIQQVVHSGCSEIFLDCTTNPSLNQYYQTMGFQRLGQKMITYPTQAFEMVCYHVLL